MKKFLSILLSLICIVLLVSCQKDPANIPALDELSEYSEEQLNEVLKGYKITDIHTAWGMPERPDGELATLHRDTYVIPNTDKTIVIYDDPYEHKVSRVYLFDLNLWVDYEEDGNNECNHTWSVTKTIEECWYSEIHYSCTVCGIERTDHGDKVKPNHIWDDGVQVEEDESGVLKFTCTRCGKTYINRLSIKTLKEIAKKGSDLTWSDFKQYAHEDIGSGLIVFRYEINEHYYLLVGGGSILEEPMYIRLRSVANEDNYIDIRTESIEDFIKD